MGPDEFVEPHYPGFIRIQIFSGAKPAKVDNPAPAAATHLGTIYVPDFKQIGRAHV